jgi:GNAT superfamily N-acetyltransferase
MKKSRNLTLSDYRLIGDIIGDSFASDPVNCWVFGGQNGIRHYFKNIARKLYLPKGYGHVMEDSSGGSLWLPPNVKKQIPFIKSIDIAAAMIRYGGFKSIPRGLAVENALTNAMPEQPHYYLFAIGCRPAHQGKGIGSALMEAGLERANLEKMPAYLESSKEMNVPFYRSYGFEVIEKIIPTKGCPPLWLMWREPR